MADAASVSVQATEAMFTSRARAIAAELNLEIAAVGQTAATDLVLEVSKAGLELRVQRSADIDLLRSNPVRVDLLAMDTQSGPGRSLQQPLAKAAGLRKGDAYRPRVVDATGGFGEDAWILASWGCEVLIIEKHPVMGAMLADGLSRAAQVQPEVADRLNLVVGDAALALAKMAGDEANDELAGFVLPEVVCLDPMFPPGRKTVERKAMRILRMLVGEDENSELLLTQAMKVATRRVAVKRPARAAPLGNNQPVSSHRGRGYRFDVYARGG